MAVHLWTPWSPINNSNACHYVISSYPNKYENELKTRDNDFFFWISPNWIEWTRKNFESPLINSLKPEKWFQRLLLLVPIIMTVIICFHSNEYGEYIEHVQQRCFWKTWQNRPEKMFKVHLSSLWSQENDFNDYYYLFLSEYIQKFIQNERQPFFCILTNLIKLTCENFRSPEVQ